MVESCLLGISIEQYNSVDVPRFLKSYQFISMWGNVGAPGSTQSWHYSSVIANYEQDIRKHEV